MCIIVFIYYFILIINLITILFIYAFIILLLFLIIIYIFIYIPQFFFSPVDIFAISILEAILGHLFSVCMYNIFFSLC